LGVACVSRVYTWRVQLLLLLQMLLLLLLLHKALTYPPTRARTPPSLAP